MPILCWLLSPPVTHFASFFNVSSLCSAVITRPFLCSIFFLLLLPSSSPSSLPPHSTGVCPFLISLPVPHCSPVLSPQICIRVSSQGLRLLCLLTCSSLSQVKSAPPSTLKACSLLPPPPLCRCLVCFVWSRSVLCLSVGDRMPLCVAIFSCRLISAKCFC